MYTVSINNNELNAKQINYKESDNKDTFVQVPKHLLKPRLEMTKTSLNLQDFLFNDLKSQKWSTGIGIYFTNELGKELNVSDISIRRALKECTEMQIFLVYDLELGGKMIFENTEKNKIIYNKLVNKEIFLNIRKLFRVQISEQPTERKTYKTLIKFEGLNENDDQKCSDEQSQMIVPTIKNDHQDDQKCSFTTPETIENTDTLENHKKGIKENIYINTPQPPSYPPKNLESGNDQGEEVGGDLNINFQEEEEKDIFSPEEKSPEDYLFFDMAAKPFYITSEAFKGLLDKYGFTKLKSVYNILADEMLINPGHGIKNPVKILIYRLENFKEKQNSPDENFDLFNEIPEQKLNSNNLKTESKDKFNDLFWYCNKMTGSHPSIAFNTNKDRVGKYFLEHYYQNYLNSSYSDEETKQQLNGKLIEVKNFITPGDFQSLIMEYVEINQVGPFKRTFANEFVLKSFMNHYLKINEIKGSNNSERSVNK